METYSCSCINWLWLAVAVVVNFIIGAFWHSEKLGFGKAWADVFAVKIPEKDQIKTYMMIVPMLSQFLAMALLGLMYFTLYTAFGSVCVQILVLCAIALWMKSILIFRYCADFKRFCKAALIEAGYFVIASVVFILASLL
jgi:hypothetical protein